MRWAPCSSRSLWCSPRAAAAASRRPTTDTAPVGNTKIVVGEKDFAGAELLSQLYGQALAAKGFKVTYKSLGPTEVTTRALKSGDIDLYGEYQGTLLTYLKGTPTGDAATTNAGVQAKVAADGLKASSAVDRARRQRLLRHEGNRDEVQPHQVVRPDCGRAAAHVRRSGRMRDRPLCLGTTEQ